MNKLIIKMRCGECTHVRDSADFARNDGSGSESRLCADCRRRRNRRCAKRRAISAQSLEAFLGLGRPAVSVK